MHRFKLASLILALPLLSASSTFGQSITHEVTLEGLSGSQDAPLALPHFDPALGSLTRVSVSIDANVDAQLALENTHRTPCFVESQVLLMFAVTDEAGSPLAATYPSSSLSSMLLPFDGQADFAGSSGIYQNMGGSIDTSSETVLGRHQAARLTGDGSRNDGSALVLQVADLSQVQSGHPLLGELDVSFSLTVSVTYHYDPPQSADELAFAATGEIPTLLALRPRSRA